MRNTKECPGCGSGIREIYEASTQFNCGTFDFGFGQSESVVCLRLQRDKLRAERDQLASRLEVSSEVVDYFADEKRQLILMLGWKQEPGREEFWVRDGQEVGVTSIWPFIMAQVGAMLIERDQLRAELAAQAKERE